MDVTVELVGEGTYDLSLDEPTPTYADLLEELELSPHEATVMVEGRPVPEDGPVEVDRVRVLRLIKGG